MFVNFSFLMCLTASCMSFSGVGGHCSRYIIISMKNMTDFRIEQHSYTNYRHYEEPWMRRFAILKELMEDSRKTTKAIAKELDIPRATVHDRIARWSRGRSSGIHAVPDYGSRTCVTVHPCPIRIQGGCLREKRQRDCWPSGYSKSHDLRRVRHASK